MRKSTFLTLLALLVSTYVWSALPASGKYYRIVNANYTDNSMFEDYQTNQVKAPQTSTQKDLTQIWLWTGTKLQNAYTGNYILAQNSGSQIFNTSKTGSNVTITQEADGHYKIKCGGNTLHCDGSKNVVKWEPENESSHWTFKEVTVTEDELNAAHAEYAEYAANKQAFDERFSAAIRADYSNLSTFFTDETCSELKSEDKSKSDADLKTAVLQAGLTEDMANIAVKVKNGWTDETDGEISAQFRVQDYAAYSVAEKWRWGNPGVSASQFNDMNNPTGLFTTDRDILYVFVGSDVPSGCELRLSTVSEYVTGFGYNNYNNGTVLQKGLNIIAAPVTLSTYWVMYSITNTSLKPADMPKIKIHIEGANVMGYVDAGKFGDDENACNAEYKKILLAANKSALAARADKKILRMATKGKYGMFNWQILCYNAIWSDGNAEIMKNNPVKESTFEAESWNMNRTKYDYKIWKSMRFYDNLLEQEWGIMGFMDDVAKASAANPKWHAFGGEAKYPTYINNLAYTIMGTTGSNPHSSTGYTHMPGIGGVESSYNAERADFDTWCVGHESGHNNQGTINMPSCMESSNNYFSQITTYQYGYRMSRGWSFMENIEAYTNAPNNKTFCSRDISITMRMYYNLYLYYHRAGKKMDFSPLLFMSLRNDPMRLGGGAAYNDGVNGQAQQGDAKNSWLKFYEKACDAAQEDLTEYFRLWGFFTPVDKYYFGDYTSYYVTLTQSDINAAIARVKAKKYPENKAIIFIEDRIKPVERKDFWATPGSTRPENNGRAISAAQQKEYYGEYGHFTDYMEGNIQNAGDYTFVVAGQQVTLTGEGGVGILVYDLNDNIVYYANKHSFKLPAALAMSDFKIKVINADQTEVTAKNMTGPEQYREALTAIIKDAEAITKLKDTTGNKVGYYTAEQLAQLEALLAAAQESLKSGEGDYLAEYRAIMAEMQRILNEESVISVKNTGLYTVQNNRSTSKYLNGSASTLAAGTTKDQWSFVPVANSDKFYLQNVKTEQYIATVINSDNKIDNWTVTTPDMASAGTFTLESAGSGSFFIKAEAPKGSLYLNLDGSTGTKVVPWSADAGSKWNIVKVKEIEEYTQADIAELATTTTNLVDEVSTFKFKTTWFDTEKLQQTTDDTKPYYIRTNATTGVDPDHTLDKALDGKNDTYFSTVGATVNAIRFIEIDLGEGNEINDLRLYYRSASNLHTLKPTSIVVQAANAKTDLSKNTVATLSGLPSNTTSAESFQSDANALHIDTPARFWRIRFEASGNTGNNGKPEVAFSRFRLGSYTEVLTMKEGYEGMNQDIVTEARKAATNATNSIKVATSTLSNLGIYTLVKKAYDKLLAEYNTTDINDVFMDEDAEQNNDGAIYDLSGRRVSKTKSGIYIINGKKVMVK